jgi:hypothetical protein
MDKGREKIVPLAEVVIYPHVGHAQGHEGHNMQDPRIGQMVQLQAIMLL